MMIYLIAFHLMMLKEIFLNCALTYIGTYAGPVEPESKRGDICPPPRFWQLTLFHPGGKIIPT